MGKAFIGNFKGPKGDTGPQGAQGIQGIQGPAGPTGAVDGNTPIEFTEAEALANIESGESISTIFGKTKKILGSLLIGAGSTLLGKNLTANQALVSDAAGKVNVSGISATELGYLSGVTKNIQAQFSEQNEKLAPIKDENNEPVPGDAMLYRMPDANERNSDANNFIKAGFYFTNTKTLNLPEADYGIVTVTSVISPWIVQTYTTKLGKTYQRVRFENVTDNLWGAWTAVATESYVDDKTKFFNYCSLDHLVTQVGITNTDSAYNFFNSSNLKPGFYFGTASGGLLKGMTTNTYNSYILFKAQTNFGKLFIMPTNGSTIYMLDAQKSDTWYTLHS